MKQILQSLKNGKIKITEVPVPTVLAGSLLIKTSKTLISSGTERMLINFGKANIINKALQQPDKLKMIFDKIRTDGLQPTIETIFNKLEQPLPLGYCNVGKICELGSGVSNFTIGDRVVSNGNHAEVVNAPPNLCAKIPDSVSDDQASFTVLAAVALQGIRLAKPTLGEAVTVIGLGLVGLMTVQLLRANGCRVLGLDFDEEKLLLAKKFGAEIVNLSKENPITAADFFSKGQGVDVVIITASTNSNEPISQATKICRKRARIILVGVTGLNLSRDDFFKKEITFQVSASYGPGRYDPNYEDKGQDYPLGFVRWTAQRNFEAVLDMMSKKLLDVESLISHRFNLIEAEKAYEIISNFEPSLGILLTYPGIEIDKGSRKVFLLNKKNFISSNNKNLNKKVSVSFLGSGNYAASILIPAFKKGDAILRSVSSKTGISAAHVGRKYGFLDILTNSDDIFDDDKTDAVVITTRHNSHANFVLKALKAKKHVFVEKPLCLNINQLNEIEAAYTSSNILMVGFNRRFAPQIKKIKNLISDLNVPKTIVMTVNAGAIAQNHWAQDLEIGGGRIIGEVCHFIDLLRFLIGKNIVKHNLQLMNAPTKDTFTIQLSFIDGSIGTIHYFANGSKLYPKERLEVFAGGGVLQLDNYLKLKSFSWPSFNKMNLWRQDKGQNACAKAFIEAISKGNESPIAIEEIFEVSRICIELASK
jgi:predicted dehydrogenase/threonine dehydrogenase-like Zn-dependent dehydrogenase